MTKFYVLLILSHRLDLITLQVDMTFCNDLSLKTTNIYQLFYEKGINFVCLKNLAKFSTLVNRNLSISKKYSDGFLYIIQM